MKKNKKKRISLIKIGKCTLKDKKKEKKSKSKSKKEEKNNY